MNAAYWRGLDMHWRKGCPLTQGTPSGHHSEILEMSTVLVWEIPSTQVSIFFFTGEGDHIIIQLVMLQGDMHDDLNPGKVRRS